MIFETFTSVTPAPPLTRNGPTIGALKSCRMPQTMGSRSDLSSTAAPYVLLATLIVPCSTMGLRHCQPYNGESVHRPGTPLECSLQPVRTLGVPASAHMYGTCVDNGNYGGQSVDSDVFNGYFGHVAIDADLLHCQCQLEDFLLGSPGDNRSQSLRWFDGRVHGKITLGGLRFHRPGFPGGLG